jgi:bacterioferritin-associated ferredoxin
MFVCLCNALTDRQVRDAAMAGADRPSQIYGACGCDVQCGNCAPTLRKIVNEAAAPGIARAVLARG